ncbi:hypothetical protein HK105_202499 [Polyrhizophydium stewartii]|uniref:Ankyrin repeat protein n=1 Tax=Polyrhizophydium stewartii TaxID=2732419 RepID=A0ABR4NEY0_9FUNG
MSGLPAEMRRAVLAAAGLLTQWVQGELADPTGSQVVDMWGDALALEWPLERLLGLPAAAVPAKTLLRAASPAALAAASRLRLHGHADDVAVAAVARGWLSWLPPEAASSPAALVLLAAAAGNTPLLEQSLAAAANPREAAAEAAVRAAAMGHVEAVAAERGVLGGDRLPPAVLDTAAAAGELPLVRWLTLGTGDPCTTAAMDGAAANGHLAVVEFLHENRLEGCTVGAMDLAATNGHLDVVVWLHTNRTEGCSDVAIDGAAAAGHVDVVQWLALHRSEGATLLAAKGAASNGHIPVLEWIKSRKPELLDPHILECAAQRGDIDTVEWILAHVDGSVKYMAVMSAAINGQTALLMHLLKDRIDDPNVVSQIFDAAVHSGNLALIQRLMQRQGTSQRHSMQQIAVQLAVHQEKQRVFDWALDTFPGEARREIRRELSQKENNMGTATLRHLKAYARSRGTTVSALIGPGWLLGMHRFFSSISELLFPPRLRAR